MHSLLARRGPLLGFVTGATVLLTASTAFACTFTVGKVTFVGATPTGSVTTFTQGNGADENEPTTRGYCTPPTRLKVVNAAPTLAFSLTASVGSCINPTTKLLAAPLPAGDYEVRWIKAAEAVQIDATPGKPDCHRDLVNASINDAKVRPWIVLGTMTVNASAPTTKSFSLATDVFRGPGNICISKEERLATSNALAPVIFINWAVI